MTKQWWLLVGSFTASVILLVIGLIQGNAGLMIAGIVIGVILYLGRKHLR